MLFADLQAGRVEAFGVQQRLDLCSKAVVAQDAGDVAAGAPAFERDQRRGGGSAALQEQVGEFTFYIRRGISRDQTKMIQRALADPENKGGFHHGNVLNFLRSIPCNTGM